MAPAESKPLNSVNAARMLFAKWNKASWRAIWTISLLLIGYFGSYSALSMWGNYRMRPSGELRYANGFAMFDTSLWSPIGMNWERRKSVDGSYYIEADPTGWLFFPCIWFDRKYIHPTQPYDSR